ncbi:MAG: CRISPR-associated protein Cas5h [Halioglobus sp.]|jgi:CRISPR-associated protein Cas5h
MEQLISFDIKSDFGFLKKPDTNEPMYLTFNMIHKPFVLGLLGAILGERGFQQNEVLPDYYVKLKTTLIGIKPLSDQDDFKGNFMKTVIKYNNGVGYASKELGGNLIITEQTLVKPSYRIYILTDNQELIRRIRNYEAEFVPYLGKNDFSLWWDNFMDYTYKAFQPTGAYQISSIFVKRSIVKDGKQVDEEVSAWKMDFTAGEFMYFERLPVGYDEELFQYNYKPFVLTTFKLNKDYKVDNLYQLDNNEVIQVF